MTPANLNVLGTPPTRSSVSAFGLPFLGLFLEALERTTKVPVPIITGIAGPGRGGWHGAAEHGRAWDRVEVQEVNPSAASTLERYCSILALRDNIPCQRIVDSVYYGKHRQSSQLHAQRFVSAAAFHRHHGGNLLLSASLGGSAALYSFAHQHKQETGRFKRMSAGDLSNALEAFATIDPFTNQGGVGTLLYARTPKPLFPTSDANQILDMDRDPIPKPRPLRRGGADPVKLARVLLQKGASPNTRLKHVTLPSWDGSYWTPWTATLLGVAGLIRKGELLDDIVLDGILLDVMELYLLHGADPTVCFVGRYLPEHKLELVPTYRVGPGVYVLTGAPDHVKNLFGEHPDRWHYITLPQLLELVAEHNKKQTVADLLYAKSSGVASQWVSAAAASWGGRGRRPGNRSLTNIKLELAQLGTCYFVVSMIVNEQELTSGRTPNVKHTDCVCDYPDNSLLYATDFFFIALEPSRERRHTILHWCHQFDKSMMSTDPDLYNRSVISIKG
ncbi:uncharacterized protein B0T15DRAFT_506579 [Chaetomium strumarium]|uniref:Uncharacterized protein n=1 Tax=Chaetomium strumarium TaxID=1170767 RepID=A0AAJ0H1J4_9PEZI|nr:hypothetical protein B0T15DRAFT_506579 [Chaetomium strumarium]